MKKNLFAVAIAATAVLSMSNAFAAAGTVNFTGEIMDAACTVDVNTLNQTVILGKYNKSEFKAAAGNVTAATKFDIVLKDCPDTVTSARVMFDGKPDATDSNLLAIDDADGAATGVAINLMTADKADLGLHGDNNYRYALSSTQDNTLDFYAQYKSTSATVTSGPANSVANFSVVYN